MFLRSSQATLLAVPANYPGMVKPSDRNRRFPNRLREVRLRRGMSLDQLARATSKPLSSVQRYETGQYQLKIRDAEIFARVLGIESAQLLPSSEEHIVPIVGKVGAGAQVFPINDHPPGTGLDDIPCPYGLDPEKTAAVVVEGDSMFPLQDGWILFFSRRDHIAPIELVGQLCIVKIADDGPTLVKQLRRGYERNRFTLVSTNAPPLENVEVEWAARVLAMVPLPTRGYSHRVT